MLKRLKTWWGSVARVERRRLRPKRRQPALVEVLETRRLLTWTSMPPSSVPVPTAPTYVDMNAAGDIVVNRAIDHNEVDWYRFVAKVSGYYTISTETPGSDLDTIIGLYSQSGTRLTYNDNGPSGTDSQLIVQLSPNQTFYVGVTELSGSLMGGYTLRIDGPPLPEDTREDNDFLPMSSSLGSIANAKTFSNLSCLDDDWFQFDMPNIGGTADYVKIDFTHSKGDLDMELYGPGGTLLGSSTTTTNTEKISLSGRPNGTYYVRVFGAGGVTNPQYSLTIDCPPLPTEDLLEGTNDTRDKAYNLGAVTTTKTWNNLVSMDEDWYRVVTGSTGTPGDYVKIDFNHAWGDLDLELYDASGNRIGVSEGYGNTERISLDGLASAAYYIRVTGYLGVRNLQYSMTIRGPKDDANEQNDTRETRKDLSYIAGRKLLSNLVLADEDWFIFGMGTTGLEGCSVTAEFDNLQGNVNLELRNMANQVVASSTTTSNTERISLAGLASGSYYVRVFGEAGARNPRYDLTFITPQDDTQEQNDTQATAKVLGTIVGTKTVSDLALLDDDWFKFTTTAVGNADSNIRIDFQHAWGDIDLALFNSAGVRISQSTGSSNTETISLDGLAAGTYSVCVYGYQGAKNIRYSLTVTPATDDAYEQNDSRLAAYNLGTLTSIRGIPDLVVADQDWFKFTTTMIGGADDYAKINFLNSQGDVDLLLYNNMGTLVNSSVGTGDEERISLQGLAAGTYYVQLRVAANVRNPDVHLAIDPPSSGFDGRHTLYLNFDGARMSSAELARWDGGEWQAGLRAAFDPEGDGIVVERFLDKNANREAIITQIMNMLQADLTQYGITVVRRTGLAVENTFSTTVFFGNSTNPEGHVACDIDVGNINRTDIAFVGDEAWADDNETAIALADVVLHEAGHTFGLYHVQSGADTETMGLRYNTPKSVWNQNTSFRDQAYRVLQDHGPDIMQNAHRYMLQTFVDGIVLKPGTVGAGGVASPVRESYVSADSTFRKTTVLPPPPPEEGRAPPLNSALRLPKIDWNNPDWLKEIRAVG